MTHIMRAGRPLALSIFALFAFGVPANADFKNGSFELPEVLTGQTRPFNKGGKIGAWKVTAASSSGDVLLVGPGYTCCGGITFPSHSGDQHVCLTGTTNLDGGVKQTIKTKIGRKYRITFYIGNINNPGQGLGKTSTVDVYIDNELLATKTNKSGSAETVTWKKYTVDFTAENSEATIDLANGDPENDGYNGLDNVSVALLP